MADRYIRTIFLLRGGTEEEWLAKDPVLYLREPGVALDTGEMKIGDGITPWSELDPINEKSIYNAATHYDFPSVGKTGILYKASEEKLVYQWNDEKLVYEPLSASSVDASELNVDLIYGGGADSYGDDTDN